MAGYKMNVVSLETKNNSFLIKRNKQIPNTITTTFLGLQLVYGFNFGFIDILNGKLRNLCKYISYFMTFVIISFIALPSCFGSDTDLLLFFNINAIMQYVGHTVFFHVTKYKMYNFIKDMRINKEDLNEKRIGWAICLCVFVTCVLKYVAAFYSCVVAGISCQSGNVTLYLLFITGTMGLDVMHLVQMIIYYYIYNSVQHLKRLAEDKQSDLNAIKEQFVLMADCFDRVKTLYGNLVRDL